MKTLLIILLAFASSVFADWTPIPEEDKPYLFHEVRKWKDYGCIETQTSLDEGWKRCRKYCRPYSRLLEDGSLEFVVSISQTVRVPLDENSSAHFSSPWCEGAGSSVFDAFMESRSICSSEFQAWREEWLNENIWSYSFTPSVLYRMEGPQISYGMRAQYGTSTRTGRDFFIRGSTLKFKYLEGTCFDVQYEDGGVLIQETHVEPPPAADSYPDV